jgi:hypothetical protein
MRSSLGAKHGGEGGIGSLRLVLRTRASRAPSSLRSVELRSHPSSTAAPRLPFRFTELPPLALQVAEREGFEPGLHLEAKSRDNADLVNG